MDELEFKKSPAGNALQGLRNLDVEPSPFLTKRVQANWQAASQLRRRTWSQRFALPVLAVALTALALTFTVPKLIHSEKSEVGQYALGQPYMIRMDVRAIAQDEIASAEIEIEGESARFTSQKFAEIREQRKVTVSGAKIREKQYLPVIVEGVTPGDAKVTVHFYNANHELIAAKSFDLKFVAGAI